MLVTTAIENMIEFYVGNILFYSSRAYFPLTGASRQTHLPLVKSGKATGMLPMEMDCSERQVTAIQLAAS